MAGELQTHRASRRIDAPPRAVFEAFTDPDAWARWLPPGGMSGRVEQFDLRPGGGYRMVLTYDGSKEAKGKSSKDSDVVEGRFLAIEPDRRLVQSVRFDSDDPAFAGEMKMMWSAEPQGEGTLVSILAEDVPRGIREADHVKAFKSSLDNLAAYLRRP